MNYEVYRGGVGDGMEHLQASIQVFYRRRSVRWYVHTGHCAGGMAGTVAGEMDPASIRAKVARRVSAYEGALDAWHERCFAPMMDHIALHSLSWEDALAWVGRSEEL
jgi:hypothetical protein